MKKFKTAFITFFPAVPDNMGSSAVVNSRFKSWPSKKMIIQVLVSLDSSSSNDKLG